MTTNTPGAHDPRYQPAVQIALVLVLALVACWLWYFIEHQAGYHKTLELGFRAETLRGDILRLDEILTMSARLGAATGDLAWEERYQQHVDSLDRAIKEAATLVPEESARQFSEQTDQANQRLVEMELRSFQLVRQGRPQEALALLLSPEYIRQKKIYAAGLGDFLEAIRHQIDASHQHQSRNFRLIVAANVLLGGVLLLIWIWVWGMFRWHRAKRRSAEEALRANQAQLQAILDNTPLAVCLKDRDGRYLFVNRCFEENFKVSRKEVLGKTVYDFGSHEGADLMGAMDRTVFTKGVVQEAELDLSLSNGKHTFISTKFPLFDNQGQVYALCNMDKDITERKKAEEALRRLNEELEERVRQRTAELELAGDALRANQEELQLLLDSSGEGIMGIDLQGHCTICNPACARLLGYADPRDLLGKSMHTLVHHTRRNGSPYPETKCPIKQTLQQGKEVSVADEVFWRADGTSFPVEYRVYPLCRQDKITGAVVWFSDISARRQNEELLVERARLAAVTGDIGMALTKEGEMQGLLQRCTQALVDHLGAAFARIWTLNPKTNVLELQASAGLYTHLDGGHARVPVGKFKIGLIAQERKPHLTNQVIGDPRVGDQEWARREGMVAFAGYPLVVGDRLFGVVALFSRQPLPTLTLYTLASVADELGLGIARILTQESLKASEDTLRTITNTALDGLILMDARGAVQHWNPAAEKIFGYAPEETLGRPLHEILVPPQNMDQFRIGMAHFVQSGEGPAIGKVLTVEALRKDGSPVPIELSISAIYREGEWQAVGILRDITERKTLENQLRLAKETAEAASRAKSEFLANMSHEIRTPLNGVLGMTQLALGTDLNPVQRKYLEIVQESGNTLLGLINDILDFSKIEAGKLDFAEEDFSLEAVLNQAVKTLAHRAHEKGLELSCQVARDVPNALAGDPGRLRQVLINLLGNAVKFTDRGEVALRVEREDPNQGAIGLHFAVRDTGIGIPADKQQSIFEAFSQADTSISRRYCGTGLGLAISSSLVGRMGGRLWVESAVGQGSTFHFTARFAPAREPAKVGLPVPSVQLRGLPVLVVDDNATNRHIFEEVLTSWQMRPKAVADGLAALDTLDAAWAAGEPYVLVLVDGMMPHMDGFTLTEHIRRRKGLADTPILILTSADMLGDSARCRALGIEGYLVKPVQPSDLLETVSRVLHVFWQDGHPPATSPAPGGRRLPPLCILLAEDNRTNQEVAKHMLEKEGHAVVIAADGLEALALLDQQEFDLVLMDVQMPEMDGFAATGAIREREKITGGHLPIIALTAHALKGDLERCLEAGMDGYVAKPLNAEDLMRTMESILGRGEGRGTRDEGRGARDEGRGARDEGRGAREEGLPILDQEALFNRVGDDRKRLGKWSELFQSESPRMVASIQDAFARGDATGLSRAAHTLKGSLATLGSVAAAAAARRLEELGQSGQLAAASEMIATLQEEVDRFQAALARLGQEESP